MEVAIASSQRWPHEKRESTDTNGFFKESQPELVFCLFLNEISIFQLGKRLHSYTHTCVEIVKILKFFVNLVKL